MLHSSPETSARDFLALNRVSSDALGLH
jgi:hypothetical protein